MTSHRTLFLTFAFGVTAAAGWQLGANQEKSTLPTGGAWSKSSAHRARKASNPQDEITKRLATIRAASTPDDRTRATLDLALSLPPHDFPAWVDGGRFTSREGMDLMLFTHILMERWENEDPEGFLLWSYGNDRGKSDHLRAAWAESEPQRLLAFFQKRHDNRNEIGALSEIAEFHPDIALHRLQEMLASGLKSSDLEYVGGLVQRLATDAPASLTGILDALPEAIRIDAESLLICQRMRESFNTELDSLRERPDGLKLLESILIADEPELYGRPSLRERLVDQVASLPRSWHRKIVEDMSVFIDQTNASKWLEADLAGCGFDADAVLKLRLYALSSAINMEPPESILRQMVEFDIPPDDRQEFIIRVFGNIDPQEPGKYETLLALLSTDEERAQARKAYEPESSPPEVPEIDTPVEWLAAFQKDGENSAEYLLMLRSWPPEKIAALTARFDSLPADQKFKTAQALVAKRTRLEGNALGYLLRQPWDATKVSIDGRSTEPWPFERNNEEIKARLACNYIAPLAGKDPESAGQWISALPEGQPKLWAAKNLHSLWSQYDPEAAGRWMKSLPAETRAKVGSLKMEANTEH